MNYYRELKEALTPKPIDHENVHLHSCGMAHDDGAHECSRVLKFFGLTTPQTYYRWVTRMAPAAQRPSCLAYPPLVAWAWTVRIPKSTTRNTGPLR